MLVLNTGDVLTAGECNDWFLPRFAYKTADTSRASTTTLANDPHLILPADASAIYQVNCCLDYSAGTTGDFNVTFTVPSGATLDWNGSGYSGSDAQMWNGGNPAGTAVAFGGGNASRRFVIVMGMLQVGGTAGSLTCQWAQSASDASATILRQYSYLRLDRVG